MGRSLRSVQTKGTQFETWPKCNGFVIVLRRKPRKAPSYGKVRLIMEGKRGNTYICRRGNLGSTKGLVASFYVKEKLLDSV